MNHLSRRTQILLDEDRHTRLRRRAESTGASIGELVRDAIDVAYPDKPAALSAAEAATALLDSDPMPVDDWSVMKAERDAMWEKHLLDDVDHDGEARAE